jgi:soluble lytic murein transglycosylase-like protein
MPLPQFKKPSSNLFLGTAGGGGQVACAQAPNSLAPNSPAPNSNTHRVGRRLIGATVVGVLVGALVAGTGFAASPKVREMPRSKSQAKSAHEKKLVAVGDEAAKDSETEKSKPSKKTKKNAPQTYKVRAGDTLSAIAARQETSVSALLKLNDLSMKSVLRVDQKLQIPPRNLSALPIRLSSNPTRLAVRKHAAIWAKRNGISRDLLEAMMWHESGFDQTKVSSTGAIGVGQIMPNTGTFIERELIGQDLNPYEMPHNVRMSARYLRYLLKVTGGDSTRALYAYYQGIGSIQARGVYPETRQYARNIQSLRKRFKNS